MSPVNKKILIICPYPKDRAPSQRLKYEQYIPFFEKEGYNVTIKPFMTLTFWDIVYQKGHLLSKTYYTLSGYFRRFLTLFSIRKYDIVYIHLWVTPFGFPLFERAYRLFSSNLIYDIDDMIFLGHSSKANKLISALKGKSKMIYLMKSADHVITCTPTLDSFVKQYNQNTTDISSTINTEVYQPIDQTEKEVITLGWSGSHSTSKYLHLLEPVFEKLLAEKRKFQVLVIGDSNFQFKNKTIPITCIPWNLETEVSDLSKIDIGLYPLPNEEWVLGKSGLKALQYMGLGIPTIASEIGANNRIIKNGENGFLVEVGNVIQWVEYISDLMMSADLRRILGVKARHTVEQDYSISANKKTYLQILTGANLE